MSIRNAAKALIVNDNKILLNRCQNSTGYSLGEVCENEIYFDLPGGGQNKYETMIEPVKRECLELLKIYRNNAVLRVIANYGRC